MSFPFLRAVTACTALGMSASPLSLVGHCKGNAGTRQFFPGLLLLFLDGKPKKVSLCLGYPSAHEMHTLLLHMKRRKKVGTKMKK